MYGINDPSGLLRPFKNLRQFSEELYAMFSAGGQTGNSPGPVRSQVRPEPPAAKRASVDTSVTAFNGIRNLRLAQAQAQASAPSIATPGKPFEASSAINRKPFEASKDRSIELPEPSPTQAVQPIASRDFTAPTPLPSGLIEDARRKIVERAIAKRRELIGHLQMENQRRERELYDGESIKPGEPGGDRAQKALRPFYDLDTTIDYQPKDDSGVYFGVVQSGSGNTYQVTLYSSGPQGDPDSDEVTVVIPQISTTDTIPEGTWLQGIQQFTDSSGNAYYSCQPPVWIA